MAKRARVWVRRLLLLCAIGTAAVWGATHDADAVRDAARTLEKEPEDKYTCQCWSEPDCVCEDIFAWPHRIVRKATAAYGMQAPQATADGEAVIESTNIDMSVASHSDCATLDPLRRAECVDTAAAWTVGWRWSQAVVTRRGMPARSGSLPLTAMHMFWAALRAESDGPEPDTDPFLSRHLRTVHVSMHTGTHTASRPRVRDDTAQTRTGDTRQQEDQGAYPLHAPDGATVRLTWRVHTHTHTHAEAETMTGEDGSGSQDAAADEGWISSWLQGEDAPVFAPPAALPAATQRRLVHAHTRARAWLSRMCGHTLTHTPTPEGDTTDAVRAIAAEREWQLSLARAVWRRVSPSAVDVTVTTTAPGDCLCMAQLQAAMAAVPCARHAGAAATVLPPIVLGSPVRTLRYVFEREELTHTHTRFSARIALDALVLAHTRAPPPAHVSLLTILGLLPCSECDAARSLFLVNGRTRDIVSSWLLDADPLHPVLLAAEQVGEGAANTSVAAAFISECNFVSPGERAIELANRVVPWPARVNAAPSCAAVHACWDATLRFDIEHVGRGALTMILMWTCERELLHTCASEIAIEYELPLPFYMRVDAVPSSGRDSCSHSDVEWPGLRNTPMLSCRCDLDADTLRAAARLASPYDTQIAVAWHSVPVTLRMLHSEEYPPDAHAGFWYPSVAMQLVQGTHARTVFTRSMQVEPPSPDLSMPFNVAALVPTALAFVLGTFINTTARKPRDASRNAPSGACQRCRRRAAAAPA